MPNPPEQPSSTPPSTTVANTAASSAATFNNESDHLLAQSLQTVEKLVTIFSFPRHIAEKAVDAIPDKSDVTLAYNYILDNNYHEDAGGPVVPTTDCPHVATHVRLTKEECRVDGVCRVVDGSGGVGGRKSERDGVTGACPSRENWVCLECGVTRCSRYVNGHCKSHWEETAAAATKRGKERGEGHCVAVSLSDLSVWCYICGSYVIDDRLTTLLQRLEELKFGVDAKG